MFSKLPMYQRIGEAAYRPGLDAMKGLDVRLNHPHKKFESIHVGGTNGKGSSAHMLASVFNKQVLKQDFIHHLIYLILENESRLMVI